MAARIRKIRHDDETRAKIQTSQLINRLMDHVDGKIELSATQVRSVEVLLNKTLPNLNATDLNVVDETPRVVSERPLSEEEWATEYAARLDGSGTTTH